MDHPAQSGTWTGSGRRRSGSSRAVFLRCGSTGQKLNSIAGLVLFAFAATHLLNHAMGLVGLEAMYEVQQWRWAVTRSLPGSLVLATSFATHVVYALAKTARRATLRLSGWEWLQLASGLLIPLL